jgi:hypothetical protein
MEMVGAGDGVATVLMLEAHPVTRTHVKGNNRTSKHFDNWLMGIPLKSITVRPHHKRQSFLLHTSARRLGDFSGCFQALNAGCRVGTIDIHKEGRKSLASVAVHWTQEDRSMG